ncbi:hypothetical protein ABHV46_10715 [Asaia sp. BMEF1]|uniref:hypothetical protein n=1 Tax=Asaia sp. BMEF1 TaxID=3155932 RepID=UPI003F66E765
MSEVTTWAVYYTAATDQTVYTPDGTSSTEHRPAGYVWNNIVWDGNAGWAPPKGSAAIPDPDRHYPIGSIYSNTTSKTAE